jgi:hypothetical protein
VEIPVQNQMIIRKKENESRSDGVARTSLNYISYMTYPALQKLVTPCRSVTYTEIPYMNQSDSNQHLKRKNQMLTTISSSAWRNREFTGAKGGAPVEEKLQKMLWTVA